MTILQLKDVTRNFGGLRAIDHLSLAVEDGELRCVIGPNGAGKTTLFNLISGVYQPDAGEVLYQGKPLNGLSVSERSRIGIGRKFQSPAIFGNLSVQENLEVAAFGKTRITKLVTGADSPDIQPQVEYILQTIRLAEKRDQLARTISHGEKQWLEIGMVLMSRPALMLLDEPTAGMTPSETHQTSLLIKEVAQETTTIVIEHDLKFIREIADIVTVLHYGTVLAEGPIDEISQNETVRQAYLGTKQL